MSINNPVNGIAVVATGTGIIQFFGTNFSVVPKTNSNYFLYHVPESKYHLNQKVRLLSCLHEGLVSRRILAVAVTLSTTAVETREDINESKLNLFS